MYELRDYSTRDGKKPFAIWLKGLRAVQAQRAIDLRLVRSREGNFGDHKACGGGVWEMRIFLGPGYRLYYALDGPRIVLLLCGGDKSSQSADIRRAAEYWKDWKERA